MLLPPSEGKAAPKRGAALDLATLSLPVLTPAREAVIEALVELCAYDEPAVMELLAVPKSQPELVSLNAKLRTSPAARASSIYTGVVYDALSYDSLSSAAKRRATGRVMVTSSVFGLVGLADRIPSYRLSGDATLPGLGGVQAHWRKHLEPAVLEALGGGLLIDLRSGTYASFWKPTAVAAKTATVRVLHEINGQRKVVSHFNKATKGRLVRTLLEENATPRTPAALTEALQDLGWTVERGEPGKAGTQLDVIVSEL
ncbi:peroxide stress protein YaaA [Nocardioides sp. Kera G14]|uniref:peroxide stress protein YaaA n=1 Tax=Nocardioides sp. Kera G14 TaxID=2884264 RepID=UPI001D1144F9|nr:peroxide stress protein YaaA [Nocardioides sp. Kera G14]UDY25352.1 peroxide stress protein YaaA [Nocardioides sp. Kera G14]